MIEQQKIENAKFKYEKLKEEHFKEISDIKHQYEIKTTTLISENDKQKYEQEVELDNLRSKIEEDKRIIETAQQCYKQEEKHKLFHENEQYIDGEIWAQPISRHRFMAF